MHLVHESYSCEIRRKLTLILCRYDEHKTFLICVLGDLDIK